MVLGLSEVTQNQLSFFFPDGEATRADDGLVRRLGENDDNKWFCHTRPFIEKERQLLSLFDEKRSAVPRLFPKGWWEEFVDWDNKVHLLWKKTFSVAIELAAQIDLLYPQYGLVEQLNHPTALRRHVVRFLYYLPKPIGEVYASPHEDYSLFTIEVCATATGLCVLRKPDDFLCTDSLVGDHSGQLVAFPGRKMTITTNGEVHGVCHGVISTVNEPRGAVVCFFSWTWRDGPIMSVVKFAASSEKEGAAFICFIV